MNYSLSTKHFDLSDADRYMIEKKLRRLTKYLSPPFHIEILVQKDTHHRSGNVITCRIKATQSGKIFHVERSLDSVQNVIDECIEALRQELIKEKGKRTRFSWRGFFRH